MPSNSELFEQAGKYIPGGVNSPVRAFRAVGGTPPFIDRGLGCLVWDVEGKEYIDYIASWGPLILGHTHPAVKTAVEEALARGSSFGMPTEAEVLFAAEICERVPSVDMVRLVSSGTEATAAAVRLARGFTGRDKILKFAGCYHGCVESLLVDAGSGIATFAIPGSPGITKGTAGDTLVAPFNDFDAVKTIMDEHSERIAAVIIEPVAGNMGVVPPADGFLSMLREQCDKTGALLIFDEVMTGFRVHRNCAQALYDVTPDITCLGKIIGGGFPAGAYGARKEIMDHIAPNGPVYQAGTLSGNPVAVAAGRATLARLTDAAYHILETKSKALADELTAVARKKGVPVTINRVGSMMTIFFTDKAVTDYESARQADADKYARYFSAMLEQGVHLAPSSFEAAFVGLAHDDEHIEKTIAAHEKALEAL